MCKSPNSGEKEGRTSKIEKKNTEWEGVKDDIEG